MTDDRYPPRMHQKGDKLYHVHRNKWRPLGSVEDLEAALRKYDDLERELTDPDIETMAGLMATFRRLLESERNPLRLAERTRKEYLRQLKPSGRLARVFGPVRLENVRPVDVGNYLGAHPHGPMANREVALLSKMYTYAIGRGYEGFNPCTKIEKNAEDPRDRYVEHWEYNAVFHHEATTVSQQMFMSLMYLTGVRTSALLRIRLSDIDRDAGEIPTVDKGGDKVRIDIGPRIEEVIGWHLDQQVGRKPGQTDRTLESVITRADRTLIRNTRGQPWTRHNWAKYWRILMAECLEDGVIEQPFHCHDLRAKRATDINEERFDAALALGNLDSTTKRHYLRHPRGRKVHELVELPTTRKKEGT